MSSESEYLEYTDEESDKIWEELKKSWLSDDGRSYEEVCVSVVGRERFDEIRRSLKKWQEDNYLFKVCHPDGSEWTRDEIEKWVLDKENTQLIYCDMEGFFIDESGCLLLADECGNFEFVGPPEFNLKFNRKPLEKELKKLDEDE